MENKRTLKKNLNTLIHRFLKTSSFGKHKVDDENTQDKQEVKKGEEIIIMSSIKLHIDEIISLSIYQTLGIGTVCAI